MLTSGSARTPCSPPPSCACLPSSSPRCRGSCAASRNSAASRSTIVFSPRSREYDDQPAHRRAPASAPGERRREPGRSRHRRGGDLTSSFGLTLSSACVEDLRAGPACAVLDDVERAVDDALGGRLLAAGHDGVHELGDRFARRAARPCTSDREANRASGLHPYEASSTSLLGALGAVLRAALATVGRRPRCRACRERCGSERPAGPSRGRRG